MEITVETIIKKIIYILNENSQRMKGHAEKVSYIYLKLLQEKGYSLEKIINLLMISLLHDIGVYKLNDRNTESDEVKRILKFEDESPHDHSIYGYLFLKNFGPKPLQKYSKIILHHHFKYIDYQKIDKEFLEESQLLYLADRVSVYIDTHKRINFDVLNKYRDINFKGEYIDLLQSVNNKTDIANVILDGDYEEEVFSKLRNAILNEKYQNQILEMIVAMVDIKSPYTMYHNINVTGVGRELAKAVGLSEEQVEKVESAARIHDIGKVVVPVEILEKNGRLTDSEFEIMKEHISKGRVILNGVCPYEKMMLATTHHEKLDGSGYPDGVDGSKLNIEKRVLCVADIVSALIGKRSYKEEFDKETIIRILRGDAARNKIDSDIVETFVNNYDEIIEKVKENCKYELGKYNIYRMEYDAIINHMKTYNFM